MSNATPTPISDIGEFALIDRMQKILGTSGDDDLLLGIGDDAAVYRIDDERAHVLTTDALIETVHFDRSFMPTIHLGFKAISVNVSDVLAMNAMPKYATVSLGLPNNISVEMVETFYRGVRKACEHYGMTLVGGDTTAARHLTVNVTVVGEAMQHELIFRRGARAGDALCVTGDLGAAYAGLKVLLRQREAIKEQGDAYEPDIDSYRYVIQRQLAPNAAIETIRDWQARGVRPNALIDISDGLGSEVHHICRASRVGARIYAAALPIALETREVANEFEQDVDLFALFGGDDYELLFSLPPDLLEELDPQSFTQVGEVTPDEEEVVVQTPTGDTVALDASGYQHFGGNGTNGSAQ